MRKNKGEGKLSYKLASEDPARRRHSDARRWKSSVISTARLFAVYIARSNNPSWASLETVTQGVKVETKNSVIIECLQIH